MIIIIGDSWGVGEWDKNCNLSGPGFGQYLMLHDRVVNLSVGAASNTVSIDRLEDFLNRYQITKGDDIFWVVTCPTRCAEGPKYFIESTKSIFNTAQDLLYGSLERANDLAQKHNTIIQLIGGVCDLDRVELHQWPNLAVRVASWSKMIDKEFPTFMIMPTWWGDLGGLIKQSRRDLLNEWIDLSEKILAKGRAQEKIFTADGHHPDRQAHLKLRNFLYPEWIHKI